LGQVRIGAALKEGGHLNGTIIKEKAKLFEDTFNVQVHVLPIEKLTYPRSGQDEQ
jgi:hypothetical protein